MSGRLVSYRRSPMEALKSGADPGNIGLVLERFIRSEESYKEEFFVVWLPLSKIMGGPTIVILSKEELVFYD